MDADTRMLLDNVASPDEAVRYEAFQELSRITESRVDWADEAWDELAGKLGSENSYQRTIGAVLLCNLAKSDTAGRMTGTLPLLLDHTHDASFITSRLCLQNVWKPAAADAAVRDDVVEHLERRFRECADEKHANLLRIDVIGSLRALYDATGDESLWRIGDELTAEEPSDKYRKQYRKALGRA